MVWSCTYQRRDVEYWDRSKEKLQSPGSRTSKCSYATCPVATRKLRGLQAPVSILFSSLRFNANVLPRSHSKCRPVLELGFRGEEDILGSALKPIVQYKRESLAIDREFHPKPFARVSRYIGPSNRPFVSFSPVELPVSLLESSKIHPYQSQQG